MLLVQSTYCKAEPRYFQRKDPLTTEFTETMYSLRTLRRCSFHRKERKGNANSLPERHQVTKDCLLTIFL